MRLLFLWPKHSIIDMSRSVRDLRELICASRLSYRDENDNEDLASTSSEDLELECGIPREVSPPKLPKRKKDLYPIKKTGRPLSPPLSSGSSGTASPLPLPPIRPNSRSNSSSGSEKELEYVQDERLEIGKVPSRRRIKKTARTNFDLMLGYADSTVIGDWLTRANTGVKDLTSWLHAGSNFVQFAHFWLSEIPKSQRRELVEVEASIIRDELCFAFGPGLASKDVLQEDIASFLSAVLWEFPRKFSGPEGGPFFLNILICLCSSRKDSYKSLLSDVKCGTEKKQFAQIILATRAFAVVNVCSGVVGFFKQISESKGLDSYIPSKDIKNVATNFAFDAVCKGFVDVLEYLMSSFNVDPQNAKGRTGKSLLFAAVVSGQQEVVRHLLQVSRIFKLQIWARLQNTCMPPQLK